MTQEPVKPKKERPKTLAVCLSGGGYRAALFHLGVLRAMHAAGLLADVQTISSVSGGSILSAFIAQVKRRQPTVNGLQFNDWENDVAAPFRQLMARDLRTFPCLITAGWNWFFPNPRVRLLRRGYRKMLGLESDGRTPTTLGHIPSTPEFIFCATDTVHGVNWEFSRERVGSYASRHRKQTDCELSTAVVASTCFPPLFGPMTYNIPTKDGSNVRMMLSDGGVYDNLGLEPVLTDHKLIFVSDGGSPFSFSASSNPLSRYSRFFFVIMNQVAALRKRQYFADLGDKLFDGSYVSIDSGLTKDADDDDKKRMNGYRASVRRKIASIRTDLDRFSDAECRILENHGFFVMAERLLSKHPHRIIAGADLTRAPHEEWMDTDLAVTALKKSHSRFSIKRILRLT